MFTVFTIISFLGFVYGLLWKIIASGKDSKHLDFDFPGGKNALSIGGVLFVIFFFITLTLVKIDPQSVGVIVSPSGVDENEIHTGWHLVAPWSTVKKMDKTVWVYSMTSNPKEGAKAVDDAIWAPTLDGIKMGFDISVNWRIDPNHASWIYENISADQDGEGKYLWIEENIIRPAMRSIVPLTISKYTPIECYSDKRSIIQANIYNLLKSELIKTHLILENAQIREVFYNPGYEASINEKKLAEQKVLTMVQITRQKEEQLKQSSIDKDIAIQKAEGEAKTLQIKGAAINSNPKIVELEWIAAWKEGGSQVPQYIGGNSGGQMFMMDLHKK